MLFLSFNVYPISINSAIVGTGLGACIAKHNPLWSTGKIFEKVYARSMIVINDLILFSLYLDKGKQFFQLVKFLGTNKAETDFF